MSQMGLSMTIGGSRDVSTPGAASLARSDQPQPIAEGSLRIALVTTHSRVLGPGVRCVVWFQGCSLNCRGCIAAEMNEAPPLMTTTSVALADWCGSIPGIQGVTLSGGDPFDQPLDALADFLMRLRTQTSLNVMLYTGRTLAQLRASDSPDVATILTLVDILIDGPYVESLNDGIGWRGSSNQRVHYLSDSRVFERDRGEVNRRLEVSLDAKGALSMVGLPARGRAKQFALQLLTGARGTCAAEASR
jgi:anaerobic ribonucleoside-triphosphate reductase activating protein